MRPSTLVPKPQPIAQAPQRKLPVWCKPPSVKTHQLRLQNKLGSVCAYTTSTGTADSVGDTGETVIGVIIFGFQNYDIPVQVFTKSH